jgi:hypothetical protein
MPTRPSVTAPTTSAATPPAAGVDPDDQLAILRALEAGEIDVDEAARRLTGNDTDA